MDKELKKLYKSNVINLLLTDDDYSGKCDVEVLLEDNDRLFFEREAEEIIKDLQYFKTQYKKVDVRLKYDHSNNEEYFIIVGVRLETDEEKEKREQFESNKRQLEDELKKQDKKDKEAKERQEYERLKKKFEKVIKNGRI